MRLAFNGASWKRVDFLVHRWTAIILGLLVFSWFLSGIALMYYPWPAVTESRELAHLEPLDLPSADTAIIGFADAASRTLQRTDAIHLARFGGRLVYQIRRDDGHGPEPVEFLDAADGRRLTPISDGDARVLASAYAPAESGPLGVDRLVRGDRYLMSREYARFFPAYRVRFDDAAGTAVYVSRDRGSVFATVTSRTRATTWLGVVPHWLYFQWLYRSSRLWTWLNLLLPAFAAIIAMTGIAFGVTRLFPRRRQHIWRLSEYRGVSNWHHVAGVLFGVIVLTWTVSGVLEMLGGDDAPRPGDGARARGSVAWDSVRVTPARAIAAATGFARAPAADVVALDLVQLDGRPGYDVRLRDRREVWVDAGTGAVRGDMPEADAVATARRVMYGPLARGGPGDSVRVTHAERIDRYDTYYYARSGRERHLPAWRVAFDDPARSVVYLNSVSGAPVGFVDAGVRRWRWWRDAAHSLDFPAINNHRPLWDAIVLPLMLGGVVLSGTGMWLVVRRLKRTVTVSRSE
ncbi:MAG TPA: PepSY domain-containing protein [Gemmatimonadaceae bacterium]|nr:PepSY domain-containing protein [Gemmatimonadaceae bacterium]